MNLYMHTIDGKLGFMSGGQICFIRDGIRMNQLFVDSLETVRKQQKQSVEYREKNGFGSIGRLGYIRVKK